MLQGDVGLGEISFCEQNESCEAIVLRGSTNFTITA